MLGVQGITYPVDGYKHFDTSPPQLIGAGDQPTVSADVSH
jgi:hypothetical protein